jgi:predicted transcriptional regulator YdeE
MQQGEVMKVVDITSKVVTGVSVRTKNTDEMNKSTAKIGGLWSKFYSSVASSLKDGAITYGVYHQYESDFTDEFTVLAGADLVEESVKSELQSVPIAEGKYAVFIGVGEMPRTVIDVWSEIWSYFSATNCPYERVYTTDFELYKGTNEVEIYIACVMKDAGDRAE